MNPTEYERKRFGYEQTVLRELRNRLLGQDSQASRLEFERPRVRVEDVRLDTSGEDRPECLFGYAVESLEHPGAIEEVFDSRYTLKAAAEIYAGITAVSREEEIYATNYALPKECSSGPINWVPSRTA